MLGLERQDIHLLWAHFMSAVDKMSTNQGERNGVSKHGRFLQSHSKHLLKGTEMKAAEKEDWTPGLRTRPFQQFSSFYVHSLLVSILEVGGSQRILTFPGSYNGFQGSTMITFPFMNKIHSSFLAIIAQFRPSPLIQKFQIHIPLKIGHLGSRKLMINFMRLTFLHKYYAYVC